MSTPLFKLPFKPYHDPEFNVDIKTEQEDAICETFRKADQDQVSDQFEYLRSLTKRDPNYENDPLFIFIMHLAKSRKEIMKKEGKWQSLSPRVKREFNEALANAMARDRAEQQARQAPQTVIVQSPGLEEQAREYLGPIGFFMADLAVRQNVIKKLMGS